MNLRDVNAALWPTELTARNVYKYTILFQFGKSSNPALLPLDCQVQRESGGSFWLLLAAGDLTVLALSCIM